MTTLDVYDEGVYQEAFRLADAVHRFLNRRSTQQVLALLDDDVVRPLIESNDRMYLLRTARISAARAEQPPAQSDEPRCSVEGCEHPPLAGCPCCYGHTVDADDPRHIPTPQLPTVDDLVGSDPDFTGGLEASEYVRRLRGDDPSSSDEQDGAVDA